MMMCVWTLFNNSLLGRPYWVYKTTCGKYIADERVTPKGFVHCLKKYEADD